MIAARLKDALQNPQSLTTGKPENNKNNINVNINFNVQGNLNFVTPPGVSIGDADVDKAPMMPR